MHKISNAEYAARVRTRFQAEHNATEQQVKELAHLARKALKSNTAECNGAPHPRAKDRADKNECAALHAADLDALTGQLQEIADALGMTVEYNGLRPCLKKGKGEYVEIPY